MPDLAFDARFYGAPALPEEYLAGVDAAPPVMDQGASSACVAFSLAECLWAYERLHGRPGALIDIAVAYAMGRRRSQPSGLLADTGMIPEDVCAAFQEWGCVLAFRGSSAADVPPEGMTIPDMATINDDAYLDQVQAAASCTVDGLRRIPDSAPDIVAETKARLYTLQQPGIFGFDLGVDFERYSGGIYHRGDDIASGGRHALSIHGWTRDGFLFQNHWGRSWGSNGFGVLSFRSYASKWVSDRTHLTLRAA